MPIWPFFVQPSRPGLICLCSWKPPCTYVSFYKDTKFNRFFFISFFYSEEQDSNEGISLHVHDSLNEVFQAFNGNNFITFNLYNQFLILCFCNEHVKFLSIDQFYLCLTYNSWKYIIKTMIFLMCVFEIDSLWLSAAEIQTMKNKCT